jgi:hypothetical protein
MKFCDAMDSLKAGAKVTRHPWREGVYFKMVGEDVKSFQPRLINYSYNEDIMVSDGWLVDDLPTEYKFCEIIPLLVNGSKAKLKDWNEMFIFLDRATRLLAVQSMEIFPFIPDFESFVAEDWIEL